MYVGVFEKVLEEMEVNKKAWITIRKAHVKRLLEVQDEVLIAYYGGLHGGDHVTASHHLGHDIYDERA